MSYDLCVLPGTAVIMKDVRERTALQAISELMRRPTKVRSWLLQRIMHKMWKLALLPVEGI